MEWTFDCYLVSLVYCEYFTFLVAKITFPKTVCFLVSSSAASSVKKNWLPLVLGPVFAIPSSPLRLNRSLWWNSSWKNRITNNSPLMLICFILEISKHYISFMQRIINDKLKLETFGSLKDVLTNCSIQCCLSVKDFWLYRATLWENSLIFEIHSFFQIA